MRSVLEFFQVGDIIPILVLIVLLRFVGHQLAGDNSIVYRWARGFAAVAFLLYAIFGIAEWVPTTASRYAVICMQALLAMGTTHGLALVLLPMIRFCYEEFWARPLEKQHTLSEARARQSAVEAQEREKTAREERALQRLAEKERERREEEMRRPPPPTREELLMEAKKRRDRTIQLLADANLEDAELRAARDRAKQRYLREIDGLM